MDFESIKNNLLNAFSQLCVMRLIISSPSEKVADLPVLYALLCLVMAPWTVVLLVLVGLLFRYGARVEKDVARR